ncbi:MAG: DUF4921 family protein [Planctomycetota bacterium]
MPELRTDPLTGRGVIIAENRAGRPSDFAAEPREPIDDRPRADCPFCPGNESQNPEPTLVRFGDDGEWRIRVVPNLFPTVVPFDSPGNPFAALGDQYRGGHEVVIETRRHLTRTSDLTEGELAEVLQVCAERLAFWRRESRAPYRLVFKNVGPAAGASLLHLHSQVITLPETPPGVAVELDNLAARGGAPWQDWLEGEVADRDLIVASEAGFVACCPPASRTAYETWIMPATTEPFFEDLADRPDRLAAVASLLHQNVAFVEGSLGADYNVMIQTSPTTPGADQHFHWRIEVAPRIASIAGFELPTGLHVNTVAPETAAGRLRAALAPVVRA